MPVSAFEYVGVLGRESKGLLDNEPNSFPWDLGEQSGLGIMELIGSAINGDLLPKFWLKLFGTLIS